MTDLLMSEMRRALHRRVVWVLIGLAIVGVAVLGVIAFTDSAGRSVAEMSSDGAHPAIMRDWWRSGADNILMISGIPLLLGGVFGGASVIGAEWRAGTVTTALTWEPRRLRLHAARMTAAFVLATVIAFVLESLFLAATLAAVLVHGSTAGTDGAWWVALLAAMARVAVATGIAALLGASLATLGRNTTFAIGAIFAWVAIVENIIRGVKPGLQQYLMGENLTIAISWDQLDGVAFTRTAPIAAATIVIYCAAIAIVAATAFTRRDVVGGG